MSTDVLYDAIQECRRRACGECPRCGGRIQIGMLPGYGRFVTFEDVGIYHCADSECGWWEQIVEWDAAMLGERVA